MRYLTLSPPGERVRVRGYTESIFVLNNGGIAEQPFIRRGFCHGA
jgi:hypothetical protein